MSDPTTTSTGDLGSITAEELIKQIKEVQALLGPLLPDVRPSPLVPPGKIYKIPTSLNPLVDYGGTPKGEIWFVSSVDYKRHFEFQGQDRGNRE